MAGAGPQLGTALVTSPTCRYAAAVHSAAMRELRIVAGALAPDVIEQASAATRPVTLEELLRVGFAQCPPWELVDVIEQDEYTHDVIVRGPEPCFLVFDAT